MPPQTKSFNLFFRKHEWASCLEEAFAAHIHPFGQSLTEYGQPAHSGINEQRTSSEKCCSEALYFGLRSRRCLDRTKMSKLQWPASTSSETSDSRLLNGCVVRLLHGRLFSAAALVFWVPDTPRLGNRQAKKHAQRSNQSNKPAVNQPTNDERIKITLPTRKQTSKQSKAKQSKTKPAHCLINQGAASAASGTWIKDRILISSTDYGPDNYNQPPLVQPF